MTKSQFDRLQRLLSGIGSVAASTGVRQDREASKAARAVIASAVDNCQGVDDRAGARGVNLITVLAQASSPRGGELRKTFSTTKKKSGQKSRALVRDLVTSRNKKPKKD